MTVDIWKIFNLLTLCPTCGRNMRRREGTSIVECTDIYHGHFVVQQDGKGGFTIAYEPKKQAIL
jgi:ribosomal protein L37AE/L43A